VHTPDIDETVAADESAERAVLRLAEEKARTVGAQYQRGLIIGADQLSEQNGQILGKPIDHDHAVHQLKSASGSSAVLHTAVAVFNPASGRIQSELEQVEVECRQLSEEEILRYLEADKPYNCCGSIKVESLGIALLKSIRSNDPNAITGLPVIKLLGMLRNEGIELP
jgi:septum formation protein